MVRGARSNRLPAWSLAAIVSACLLPTSAPAMVGPAGPLSPLLHELARPAVAARPPAAQAGLLGVGTSGPGSLAREGERVLVIARFGGNLVPRLPELREAGAHIVSASPRQQTTTLSVAPEALPALAAVPGLRSAWQVRRPILYAVEGPCEGGSVISEGLGQLRVDEAREAFELRGKGVTIGVLSDSYDAASQAVGGGPIATHAAEDVASNDLPGLAGSCSDQQLPVDVLAEGATEDAGDEGRAMLQILHDLAPHAKLAFATAFEGEESFAQNIELLARPVSEGGAGADVIVDDVGYVEEPFFQDGPVAAAIDEVTSQGVTYLSAAGNDNLFDSGGNEIASWEAPAFRDSGGCPEAIANDPELNGEHCMDFDPGAETDPSFGITVEAGETLDVDLQWAEPWNGVLTDLDAVLLDGTGKRIAESVEDNASPSGTQRPVEILEWTNESNTERTVQLSINRFSGLSPRLKLILLENGGGVSATEYPTSDAGDVVGPTIFGHAGAASAIAVAAVPFNNPARVESYSSRGPVTHYFGPVEGTIPALPLGSPEEVSKPDLAASDCGATTFFAFFSGVWRFCGTSAAAPHAAAVAALVRQAKPTLPEQQVRGALTDTAAPVGAFPPEAAGAGLLDAFASIGSLPGPIEGGDGPSESVTPVEELPGNSPTQTGTTNPAAGPAPPPPVAVAPNTNILKHPAKVVRARSRTSRAVFRFGSDQVGVSFLCKIDRSAFRSCGSRLARRFGVGLHVLTVKAVSSAGLADPTPAVFRFRVKRVS